VPALCAARMEQQIVKVPKNQVVVTLGRPQATVASRGDLEQDIAINQQGENLAPRKAVLPTEPFDRLRCRVALILLSTPDVAVVAATVS